MDTSINLDSLQWVKSSASAAGAVRRSGAPTPRRRGGARLQGRSREPCYFTRQEWAAFLTGVKNGEFDPTVG